MAVANNVGDQIATAYREGVRRTKTWSGFPVKGFYGPEDLADFDPRRDLGAPGAYPYTRGIYPDMYRGRLWSRRELCGYDAPDVSNERLRFLIAEGESALNVIFDGPTQSGVDVDHPIAALDVGLQGVPVSSARDMEALVDGVPLDRVSFNVSSIFTPLLPLYFAAAQRKGFAFAGLRGTVVNDTLTYHLCGWDRRQLPLDLGLKLTVDSIEFCIKEAPLYNPLSVDVYDIRETGVNAVQEVAIAMGLARQYLRSCLERGLDVDDVAPRVATMTHSVEMDFFEEIAKLRAARRIWARMLKEEFGAKSERALKYKFHVHTAGSSLVYQQPLNNAIRVAYEALAAVLAGCQSMHSCAYDEPIGLPIEESARLAIRTQQIIAHETGVAAYADPLGGSYVVEHLTSRLEREILKLVAEIDARGGMLAALQSGWIESLIREEAMKRQQEIESGERVIVGVNAYQVGEEADPPVPVHRADPAVVQGYIDSVRRLRAERDNARAVAALERLYRLALADRRTNLMAPMIEAFLADATLGEVSGALRLAWGYPYDVFGALEPPFVVA